MNGIRRKRTYDKEFKLEAVRLVLEEGHSVASVERKLGTGKGNLKPPEKEIHELRKELEQVKRERDILKKTVAIFSKDPDRYTRS